MPDKLLCRGGTERRLGRREAEEACGFRQGCVQHRSCVVEATNSGIAWAEPRDLSLDSLGAADAKSPALALSSHHGGRSEEFFFTYDYGTGVCVAMADGSVHFLRTDSLSPEDLRKVLQIGGCKERGERTARGPGRGRLAAELAQHRRAGRVAAFGRHAADACGAEQENFPGGTRGMSEPESPPAEPKPKLRWYQYRLRTLLFAPVVLAVVFSWPHVHRRYIVWRLEKYDGADLMKLPDEEQQRIGQWIASLIGQKLDGPLALFRENWLLHSSDSLGTGRRLLVIQMEPEISSPGNSDCVVYHLDNWGRLVHSMTFNVGYRAWPRAAACDDSQHGFLCLTVETEGMWSGRTRQFYYITVDRIVARHVHHALSGTARPLVAESDRFHVEPGREFRGLKIACCRAMMAAGPGARKRL